MPADGADQTTRTFWTRWRVDIRAPLMVRLLTYAPSAQRRPAGEKTTAAQGPPSNIAGSCFRVVFGDATPTRPPAQLLLSDGSRLLEPPKVPRRVSAAGGELHAAVQARRHWHRADQPCK